jgi:AcrR family transcriptional regulator
MTEELDELEELTEEEEGRPYGGKSVAQRRHERRERLLDAGLELFGTLGYQATTIEAICAEAHVHPRYFYEEFGGREELLGAVYDRHVDAVMRKVSAATEAAGRNSRSRLEAGLREFVTATLADERAARVNYFEIVGVSPELEARRRAVLRDYAEMIAARARALSQPRQPTAERMADARLIAVAFVGATDGLLIDWLTNAKRGDRDELVATLISIFVPEQHTGEGQGQSGP